MVYVRVVKPTSLVRTILCDGIIVVMVFTVTTQRM